MTVWASIDLGSNTFRLVVARETAPGVLEEIRLVQRVVRAGEGLGAGRTLGEAALRRIASCLDLFSEALEEAGATIRVAALTATGRDLPGGGLIADLAREKLKAWVIVPTGGEEAEFSFWGALSLARLDPANALLLDIGGGSSEIAYLGRDRELRTESLKLGVVRLTEAVQPPDPAGKAGFRSLRKRAEEIFSASAFASCAGEWKNRFAGGGARLVTNAGTPLTLAAMKTGFPLENTRKLTGVTLTLKEVRGYADLFMGLKASEIAEIPGVAGGREDVILSGVAILSAFMELCGAKAATVSDGGLAEGLLLSAVRKVRGEAAWKD